MKRIIEAIKRLLARFRRTGDVIYEAEMTAADEDYWRLENIVTRSMAGDIDDDWG